MGVTDEHWCSVCKRSLSKEKDTYIDFELLNPPTKKKKWWKLKKRKGLICKECIEKDEKLKEALVTMTKAGNPPFTPILECLVWKNCPTYEPVENRPIRCGHIAVIRDRLYCKRSHVGTLELAQEKAEVDRLELETIKNYFEKILGGPVSPEQFDRLLKLIYVPPSGVVEFQPKPKKDGG